MGRAKHHHAAAEVAAEVRERLEIRDGTVAHIGIGMRDVKAFRLREQPVKPDAFEPRAGDGAADLFTLRWRNVRRQPAESEWSNLEAPVAALGGEVAGPRERPVLEGFVADGVGHGRVVADGGEGKSDRLKPVLRGVTLRPGP
jgi:hypothetical protein